MIKLLNVLLILSISLAVWIFAKAGQPEIAFIISVAFIINELMTHWEKLTRIEATVNRIEKNKKE